MFAEPVTADGPRTGDLPIIVGVTGHRDLREADVPALEAAVAGLFAELGAAYPTTPLMVLSPLAEGADQLVARVAARHGIRYRVPLPMPADEYRRDFSGAALREFDRLLAGADASYVIRYFPGNNDENVSEPERRAEQYALVGAHLTRASHALIALWNGEESGAIGGTAQIVHFRLYSVPSKYLVKASVLDAADTGPVWHIYAPRVSDVTVTGTPGARRLLTSEGPLDPALPDPLEPVYRRIEDFNRDCLLVPAKIPPNASRTERLMADAEAVAGYYQKRTHGALRNVFVATGLAALVLAFYSNLATASHLLFLPYAAALLLARVIYGEARKGRWQDRSQDYRALEVGLAIQRVWDLSGVDKSVADYYVRRQRSEFDWIRDAIRSVHDIDHQTVPDQTRGLQAIREYIAGQHAYFVRASARESRRNQRFERISAGLLAGGFFFSALLVSRDLVDFITHYFHLREPAHAGVFFVIAAEARNIAADPTVHSGVIFLIAAATIAAALLHDYPQQRAFRQHSRRYAAMGEICQRALIAIDEADEANRYRLAQDVIFDVGREALMENGDWVILHREMPIEMLRV